MCCLWYLGHFFVFSNLFNFPPSPFSHLLSHQTSNCWPKLGLSMGLSNTLPLNIPIRDFPSSSKLQVLPSAQFNLKYSYRHFSKILSDLRHPVLYSISMHYYISLVKAFGIKNGLINPWAQTIVSIHHVCLHS